MMKKVEGLKRVTLAADTEDKGCAKAHGRDPRAALWVQGGTGELHRLCLTCRHWQLSVDLVHKDLPAGLHHYDLKAAQSQQGKQRAGVGPPLLSPGAPAESGKCDLETFTWKVTGSTRWANAPRSSSS